MNTLGLGLIDHMVSTASKAVHGVADVLNTASFGLLAPRDSGPQRSELKDYPRDLVALSKAQ